MDLETIEKVARDHPLLKLAISPLLHLRGRLLKEKRDYRDKIVGNLERLFAEDPVVNVEEFGGVFAVGPQSDLFMRLVEVGCYEPVLAAYCKRFVDKNRDVVDIGANVGFYTILCSKILSASRRVFSVEPTDQALKRLRKNLELNDVVSKAVIFEGVLSNKKGDFDLRCVEGKEEYSSIGRMEHPCIKHKKWNIRKVESLSLDSFVQRESVNCGFVKMDVEGVEHLVLQGAADVLNTHRPVVLSELADFLLRNNGSSATEVVNLVRQHDYDVFDPADPYQEPGTKDSGNMICLPKELGMTRERLNDALVSFNISSVFEGDKNDL